MITKNVNIRFFLFFIASILIACTHIENGNEIKISSHGEKESHNLGKNCLSCHKQGGDGEGWFKMAGSVWSADGSKGKENVTIELYTGENGTGEKKYYLEGDQLGNFYTTENIDFSKGLYPSVQNGNQKLFMSSPIFSGACNSCHGVSTDKIKLQ